MLSLCRAHEWRRGERFCGQNGMSRGARTDFGPGPILPGSEFHRILRLYRFDIPRAPGHPLAEGPGFSYRARGVCLRSRPV